MSHEHGRNWAQPVPTQVKVDPGDGLASRRWCAEAMARHSDERRKGGAGSQENISHRNLATTGPCAIVRRLKHFNLLASELCVGRKVHAGNAQAQRSVVCDGGPESKALHSLAGKSLCNGLALELRRAPAAPAGPEATRRSRVCGVEIGCCSRGRAARRSLGRQTCGAHGHSRMQKKQ